MQDVFLVGLCFVQHNSWKEIRGNPKVFHSCLILSAVPQYKPVLCLVQCCDVSHRRFNPIALRCILKIDEGDNFRGAKFKHASQNVSVLRCLVELSHEGETFSVNETLQVLNREVHVKPNDPLIETPIHQNDIFFAGKVELW